MENEPARKGLAFDKMCKGWVMGSSAFKKALAEDHTRRLRSTSVETEAKELLEEQWLSALSTCLKKLGKTLDSAAKEPKARDWKVATATHIRTVTTATNPWLAAQLHMGKPGALSRYVAECKAGHRISAARLLNALRNVKSEV